MKKIITTAIIASIMSMAAIPAMAGPYHGHSERHQDYGKKHHQFKHSAKPHQKHMKPSKKSASAYHKMRPTHDWKRGQIVKHHHRTKSHWVSHQQHRHLPKARHNERWLKINEDYVLINTLSNVIVHMIAGR